MTKVSQSITTEVTFHFTAMAELSDYGVDRSPKWVEFVDEEFDSMEIGDVIYEYADLVKDFGQHGADGLVQIGRDRLDGDGWE